MFAPELGPSQPETSDRLRAELHEDLALIAENFMPQDGYRLDLYETPLNPSQQHALDTAFGIAFANAADLSFGYDAAKDTIRLDSLRLGLPIPWRKDTTTLADQLVLARTHNDFQGYFSLTGKDLPAAGVTQPIDSTSLEALMASVELDTSVGEKALWANTYYALAGARYWQKQEQQNIPLTPDAEDVQQELVIRRTTSVKPGDFADTGDDPAEVAHGPHDRYNDTYELILQNIVQLDNDSKHKRITEQTLRIADTFVEAPSYRMAHSSYDLVYVPKTDTWLVTNRLDTSIPATDTDIVEYVNLLTSCYEDS